jgi:pimeloyl-ACP methyl ester carboxylesterase
MDAVRSRMQRVLLQSGLNIALLVVVLAALLAVVGFSYQVIEQQADARRYPEVGRLVDVGDYRLNINCSGRGSPTVVLEAGLNDTSFSWRFVQPEIAKFARACSYDRAGYGWSDAGPMPRTSAEIAKELHALLQNAGEKPPFVMVGHSFGGYNVRVYNGQYGDQVAGMVLVDSTQEDQYALLPEAWKRIGAEQVKRYERQARFAPLFVNLGLARLTLLAEARRSGARGLDKGAYLILQSKYLQARTSELENIQESAREARAAGWLGDKPLVVLTAGKDEDPILAGGMNARDLEEFNRIWVDDLQMRLTRLSTRGMRVIVADSGHDIPSEDPNAIVRAVREVCAAVNSH